MFLKSEESPAKYFFVRLMLMVIFSDSGMNKATFWWMELAWLELRESIYSESKSVFIGSECQFGIWNSITDF